MVQRPAGVFPLRAQRVAAHEGVPDSHHQRGRKSETVILYATRINTGFEAEIFADIWTSKPPCGLRQVRHAK